MSEILSNGCNKTQDTASLVPLTEWMVEKGQKKDVFRIRMSVDTYQHGLQNSPLTLNYESTNSHKSQQGGASSYVDLRPPTQ